MVSGLLLWWALEEVCMTERLLPLLGLLILCGLCVDATAQVQGRVSEEEQREAQRVAKSFLSRIQRSRNVGELRDLFVADFGQRYVASQWGDIGSSVVFNNKLRTEVSPGDWERYYAAQVSLRYCVVLYILSTMCPDQIRAMDTGKLNAENLLAPPEVYAIFDTNPVLVWDYRKDGPSGKREVETVEDFHALIAVLEKATAAMRERFKKKSPEESTCYRDNFASEQQEDSKQHPEVYDKEMFGFPPGTHFFRALTKPPVFDLLLVKTERGVRIAFARVYPFN